MSVEKGADLAGIDTFRKELMLSGYRIKEIKLGSLVEEGFYINPNLRIGVVYIYYVGGDMKRWVVEGMRDKSLAREFNEFEDAAAYFMEVLRHGKKTATAEA